MPARELYIVLDPAGRLDATSSPNQAASSNQQRIRGPSRSEESRSAETGNAETSNTNNGFPPQNNRNQRKSKTDSNFSNGAPPDRKKLSLRCQQLSHKTREMGRNISQKSRRLLGRMLSASCLPSDSAQQGREERGEKQGLIQRSESGDTI